MVTNIICNQHLMRYVTITFDFLLTKRFSDDITNMNHYIMLRVQVMS